MTISAADWSEYVNKLAKVNTKAAELMQEWIDANGTDNINALFEYAYALSTKYGEAAASLACEMYDSIALVQGVSLPPALPADTAKIGEVKHLVGKALQKSPNLVPQEVSKMVKQAGADTMLHNAARDGAEWAWVPHGGETCAFCITLASKGWQTAGKSLLYNHAEHIHANCRCEFAIRHDKKSGVQGYDPQKYLDMYNSAKAMGGDPINNLRNALSSVGGVGSEGRNSIEETVEWKKRFKDNKANIIAEPVSVVLGGKTYFVDGVNVINDHNKSEEFTAKVLSRAIGEEVVLCPRITGKYNNVSSPDYLVGNDRERWDQKGLNGSGKDALRDIIKRKKEQANNFIVDISKWCGTDENVLEQAEKIFVFNNTRFVNKLVIIRGEDIIKVLKRK